jgi:hypothetical protein
MARPGNDPRRRVAREDGLDKAILGKTAENASYAGSGHHKRFPGNYNFDHVSPRPTKSLCDLQRVIPLQEAKGLLKQGILSGLVSQTVVAGFPKFVWCVNSEGEVFEAKTDVNTPGVYHGYRIEEEDDLRKYIKAIWKQRCQRP